MALARKGIVYRWKGCVCETWQCFVRVSPNIPWRVNSEEGMNIVDSDTQKR